MDIVFAGTVYIPRRMREMGYRDDYIVRVRPFLLAPAEQVSIEAYGEYYILISADEDTTISSRMGVYNPTDRSLTEQLEEHQGLIVMENTSSDQYREIRFIQVIPKNHSGHDR